MNQDNKIPQSEIDRARYDIEAVVSSRVQLRKAGKSLVACCPFHQEKTPSFSVANDKGFFYCFGCGASGDAIEFIMQYDGLEFPAAIEAINGKLPASVTPERVQARKLVDHSIKPSEHREDAERSANILSRCIATERHQYLLSNNTASFTPCLELKGSLIVELRNLAGEIVNVAAIKGNGEIQYAAGGISYGAVAVLEPEHEPDGATVLCVDYAEAWRLWWIMKGKTKIICAMEYDNAKWIADKHRVRFTHVGCTADHQDYFLDYGHEVLLIPGAYDRKIA